MELASREKVTSYREAVEKIRPWLLVAGGLAAAGYLGALWAGNSSVGWYCLVVAIASSFWFVILGIHTQEQEQTAALLEYMVEIAEHSEKARAKGGA